jgi:hypothetical protein
MTRKGKITIYMISNIMIRKGEDINIYMIYDKVEVIIKTLNPFVLWWK